MVDKIYMLHHEEFSKRFDYFSKRLKEENVEYKIINSYHPSEINYEQLMLNHEYFPQVYIEQIKHYSYHNFFKKYHQVV